MRLYPRLAVNGIRNNGKLYYPFIGTCIGIIAIFYIVASLSVDPALKTIKGGTTLQSLMAVATVIVGIFAVLFLFFTNSFVVKRRIKEFGLYNVLGMNKINISRIMMWETLIVYVGSTIAGIMTGILLSKFAEVGLARIVKDKVGLKMFVPFFAVKWTVIVFLGVFALIFLNSLRYVSFANPTQMIKSEQLGEKPPKGNFVIGALGFVILAVAYFLANYNLDGNPIGAIGNFMAAIIMVIVATYLIFIAGTVMVCKALAKNKNYYYNKKHFVSVSSMVFRMKRSGAGLATICILTTMVLVMMCSATSLYAGQQHVADQEYPRDNVFQISILSFDYELASRELTHDDFAAAPDDIETYIEIANRHLEEAAVEHEELDSAVCYGIIYNVIPYEGNRLLLNEEGLSGIGEGHIVVSAISLDGYNKCMGTDYVLGENEVLLYSDDEHITFDAVQELDLYKNVVVAGEAERNELVDYATFFSIVDSKFCIVTNDLNKYRSNKLTCHIEAFFDGDFESEFMDELVLGIVKDMEEYRTECYGETESGGEDYSYYYGNKAEFLNEMHGVYGGIMFMGIILTIVFLGATVLLMYYRQLVEGYEDQARFKILRNVGMEKKDIASSINSQIIIVFLAPVLLGGLHTAFALPFVCAFLKLQGMMNVGLIVRVALITFIAFAIVYFVIYKLTSRAYFKIVNS